MVNECLELMDGQTLMQQVINLKEFQGFQTRTENYFDGSHKCKMVVVYDELLKNDKLLFNETGTKMIKTFL